MLQPPSSCATGRRYYFGTITAADKVIIAYDKETKEPRVEASFPSASNRNVCGSQLKIYLSPWKRLESIARTRIDATARRLPNGKLRSNGFIAFLLGRHSSVSARRQSGSVSATRAGHRQSARATEVNIAPFAKHQFRRLQVDLQSRSVGARVEVHQPDTNHSKS